MSTEPSTDINFAKKAILTLLKVRWNRKDKDGKKETLKENRILELANETIDAHLIDPKVERHSGEVDNPYRCDVQTIRAALADLAESQSKGMLPPIVRKPNNPTEIKYFITDSGYILLNELNGTNKSNGFKESVWTKGAKRMGVRRSEKDEKKGEGRGQ